MDALKKTVKLSLRGVSRTYGGRAALESVSFDVYEGEFLSILGPSGCGKTTLLRILIGLLPPDGGRILLDGRDITSARPSERNMGIVFQNYALFENMTVLQNVAYALALHTKDKRGAREEARRMLAYMGMKEQIGKKPAELSGGQQQRVAIARTLVLKPEIILFDEPMSALDVDTRIALRRELKKLQRETGITMIYVTHDQEEAFALSDRVMIMENARIVQLDTPEEISLHPANGYVRTFVLDNLRAKVESIRRFVRDGDED